MLFKVEELIQIFHVSPNGVLHVGAHHAEEAEAYEKSFWTPVTWVEANPVLARRLQKSLDNSAHQIINATISSTNGEKRKFYISNNTQSSSLLKFNLHEKYYKDIKQTGELEVETSRIDKIILPENMPNFLNLDIQGVELDALKSLGELISKVDYIYIEVNKKQLYQGGSLVSEIDSYLSEKGFKREAARYYIRQGWGDAIFIRKSVDKHLTIKKRFVFYRSQFEFYLRQLKQLVAGLFRRLKRKCRLD